VNCHKPVTDLASDRIEQLRSICANFPGDKLVALPVSRFEQFLDLIDATSRVVECLRDGDSKHVVRELSLTLENLR